jgi:hypothetical protein
MFFGGFGAFHLLRRRRSSLRPPFLLPLSPLSLHDAGVAPEATAAVPEVAAEAQAAASAGVGVQQAQVAAPQGVPAGVAPAGACVLSQEWVTALVGLYTFNPVYPYALQNRHVVVKTQYSICSYAGRGIS